MTQIDYTYKAFISYSHAADGKLAPALQSALHRFTKPWYRLRAMRVFRDKTSLAMTPELWPSIEKALSESEYFLLLASPQAAQSQWVQQEVDWWCDHRSSDTLFIVLTDGDVSWNRSSGDFDWTTTTSLPPNLQGRFKNEPLYVDLRWAGTEEKLSLRHSRFRAAILDIAAPLHGKPKDELDGEDVRQYRRTKTFASGGVAAILAFAATATWQWSVAVTQRKEAEHQTNIVRARLLSNHAQSELIDHPQRSLLLGIRAVESTVQRNEPLVPSAEQALRDGLAYIGGLGLSGHTDGISAMTISPDSRWLVTGSKDGSARVWDLMSPQTSIQSQVLPGHKGEIHGIAFSPDSAFVTTIERDGLAQLWDLTSPEAGSKPTRVLNVGDTKLFAVGWDRHKRCLVVGGKGSTLWIWNLTLADLETPVFTFTVPSHGLSFDEQSSFQAAVLGRDNERLLALIQYFPDIQVKYETLMWELRHPTNKPITLPGGADSRAISPDNHWVVTAQELPHKGHVVNLWDVAEHRSPKPVPLHGHGYFIRASVFSADSGLLATGSWDQTARLWEFTKSDRRTNPVILEGGANVVSISSDKHWVVTASTKNEAKLWDLTAQNPKASAIPLRGHEAPITAATFSPNNRWLATGSWDGTARLWDLHASQQTVEPRVLRGHGNEVYSLAMSSNNILASGSWGSTAIVWNLNETAQLTHPLIFTEQDAYSLSDVAISLDGRWLATTDTGANEGGDRSVFLWDLSSVKPTEKPRVLLGHEGIVKSLTFTPDGHWLVTGSEDSTARLWDLRSDDPSLNAITLKGHTGTVASLAISRDSRWLCTGSFDTTARLWNLAQPNPTENSVVLPGHTDNVNGVAISPDGKWLVTGSKDRTVRLWSIEGIMRIPEPTAVLHHDYDITLLDISSDSRWIAAASRTKNVSLWDLSSPDLGKSRRVLSKHLGGITSIAFSSNSHRLATGSADGTVRLWDLTAAEPEVEPIILRGQGGGSDSVWSLAFSSDNHWLASGGSGHTVRLWNLRLDELMGLAHTTVGRNLLPAEIK